MLVGGSIGGIGEGVLTGCWVLGIEGGGRDGTVGLPADVERRDGNSSTIFLASYS